MSHKSQPRHTYPIVAAAVVILAAAPSCGTSNIKDDPSPSAVESGQATMLLGSDCGKPLALGYSGCQLRDGQDIPPLKLLFFNPADYAVSDCNLGIYKTGTVTASTIGQMTEIDLSGLTEQIQRQKFCLLRIEAVERYPDPMDPSQSRQIPLVGGYFIEQLNQGYFPTPDDSVTSWCFKVSGTNKGRRKIETCQ